VSARHTPPAGDLDLAEPSTDLPEADDPEAGSAAGVATTLGEVVGTSDSDADGSALD